VRKGEQVRDGRNRITYSLILRIYSVVKSEHLFAYKEHLAGPTLCYVAETKSAGVAQSSLNKIKTGNFSTEL
jgi:hypothetical protein